MSAVLFRSIDAWRQWRRRHKEALAASKRLSSDETAWVELFRRDDWAPPAAGHIGRCGHCGSRIDLTLVQCPHCGAEWKPNTRRSDLYKQVVVYSGAVTLSALAGYAGASWLRAHFAGIQARGEFVNPEMIDTLTSFTWLFCSVLMMIALTYAIERLAPIGHWRTAKAQPAEGNSDRRKRG
jgi:hypothetical protein